MADLHEQPVLPDIEQAADDARVQNPRDSLVKAMATGEAAVQKLLSMLSVPRLTANIRDIPSKMQAHLKRETLIDEL